MKDRVYCSGNCRDAHRKTLTGVNSPSFCSLKITCEICGKEFITQPARIKNRQVYCSMQCGREGRRRKISGASRKSRPFGNQGAKVRDQFQCRICGFNLAVHAHHIIHRKNGGSNHHDNLITLCPNHHAMAHAGLLSEQEMFDSIKQELPKANILITKALHQVNYNQ